MLPRQTFYGSEKREGKNAQMKLLNFPAMAECGGEFTRAWPGAAYLLVHMG